MVKPPLPPENYIYMSHSKSTVSSFLISGSDDLMDNIFSSNRFGYVLLQHTFKVIFSIAGSFFENK